MGFLRSLGRVLGVMLLTAAPILLFFSLRELAALRPASAYQDLGVCEFVPDRIESIQTKSRGSAAYRRTNPTRIVYRLIYKARDGSARQYRVDYPARTLAQEALEEAEPVDRRVLRIPEENAYLTLEPDQDAQSYTRTQRLRYLLTAGVCGLYLLARGGLWARRRHLQREARLWDF